MIVDLLKRLWCSWGYCPGTVISGMHDGKLWLGWRCIKCGKVKHYTTAEEVMRKHNL